MKIEVLFLSVTLIFSFSASADEGLSCGDFLNCHDFASSMYLAQNQRLAVEAFFSNCNKGYLESCRAYVNVYFDDISRHVPDFQKLSSRPHPSSLIQGLPHDVYLFIVKMCEGGSVFDCAYLDLYRYDGWVCDSFNWYSCYVSYIDSHLRGQGVRDFLVDACFVHPALRECIFID